MGSTWDNSMLHRPPRHRPISYAIAGAAVGAVLGTGLAAMQAGGGTEYPVTIECQRVHADDLAPEAVEAIDRLRWDYPAERVVIDERDGTVRALPIALVPPPCNTRIEEDEVLVIR